MNLPQDTIIKVGRGGVSNQGNKKGENRTYFNQETKKLFESQTKHEHTKQTAILPNPYITKKHTHTQTHKD